jgi:hypothetical protein
MTGKLLITGDSFSYTGLFDNERAWPNQIANKLNFKLINASLVGCSQDFICQAILDHIPVITPDDQLIVVLTGPNRIWLFEDAPTLTHPWAGDLETTVGKDRALAAKLYFKHIQRPQLDTMHVMFRLAWLNHLTVMNNWRKPLVILGFSQDLGNFSNYPNLIFSNGNLTEHVTIEEQTNPNENLFNGYDPRYNHMCLSNHDILVEKIYQTLTLGSPLDLTYGFNKRLLSKQTLQDKSLADKELCLEAFNVYNVNNRR